MVQALGIEDLRKIYALTDLSDSDLNWLLERGEYLEYEDGTTIMKTGGTAENMVFILDGKVDFYMDMNGKLVFYHSFENSAETGGVTGLLPYSRMKLSLGNAYTVGNFRGFQLHKKHFPELERLNPEFIQKLIGYMTERAKTFATIKLQHEKVNALGKLSAGIAHELNNPAAAINRISSELTRRLKLNYELTEKLLQHGISTEHIKEFSKMVDHKEKNIVNNGKLSALQRVENEEEIMNWLEVNGLSENRQAGETFAEVGFLCDDFETIRKNVGHNAFIPVMHWLENLLSSERLLKDLDLASDRISKLVGAIKSHVHMDRSSEAQCCTDIHNDIENSLTLLGYKLREKNLKVQRHYSEGLPEVEAYIGELNQVWTNIIDNAIYALRTDGEIKIITSFDKKNVTVRIIDNGPGIPQDIISRVFDPFFTTKKVGEGTGIGLDLVRRIINRHNGEIKVKSTPGSTEFEICIPIKQEILKS